MSDFRKVIVVGGIFLTLAAVTTVGLIIALNQPKNEQENADDKDTKDPSVVEPKEEGYHNSRFLAIRNATSQRLKVWIQYHTPKARNNRMWFPVDPADSTEAIVYQLAPRKVTFVEHEGARVSADRVRIWAESENGWTWPAHQGKDLWLVAENPTGQRRYRAQKVETHTQSFDAPKEEITFNERLIQVHNPTKQPMQVEARALIKGLDGQETWRPSAPTRVRPGQKLLLRGEDGWLLRGSQVRIWAQDELGELYRWWTYQEKTLALVAKEGYQAKVIGSAVFHFKLPDNAEAQAEKKEAVFEVPPDWIQLPLVVGMKLDAARAELAKVGLKAGFEAAKVSDEDLVTGQEPAAGWSPLVPEVLLTVQAAVPNVIGRTFAEAKAELAEAGLLPADTEDEPKGVVTGQDPPAEQLVKKGSKVALVFKEQDGKIKVPNLVGRDFQEVKEDLEAIGLKIAAGEEATGRVESQDPPADTPVDKGSTVTVVLGKPMGEVVVPDLVGRTYEEARQELEDAGLKIASADDGTEGTVASQDPPAAMPVMKGATVTVVLRVAEPTVKVPDLVGKTFADAQETLEAAGLKIGGAEEAQAGKVVSQEPAAETPVPMGTTVMVVLGAAPDRKIIVPSVLGLNNDEAKEALEAVGLVMAVETAARAGVVEKQDPASGIEVEAGATVTVRFPGAAEPPEEPPQEPPQEPPPEEPALPPEEPPVEEPPPEEPPQLPPEAALVEVPDVVGMSALRARVRIAAAGLVFLLQGNPVAAVAATQFPAAGTQVPAGSLVVVGFAGAETVIVPAVVNLPFDQAQARIVDAGLVAQPLGDPRTGRVRTQFPAAGVRVLRGAPVTLTFFPAPLVEVPNVVGNNLADVRRAIGAAGLVARVRGNPNRGPARSQNPVAGTQVARGSAVNVFFGAANDIAVPLVVGLGENDARARIEGAGLVARVRGNPNLGPARNQFPIAGTLVARGSLVTAIFGRPARVRIPNVVGATVVRARRVLQTVGLVIAVRGDPRLGTARRETPPADTLVNRGSTVNVDFASMQQVRVPPVLGLNFANARARIEAVGLVIQAQGNLNQRVARRQTPAANTLLARGSTVTVIFDQPALVDVPDVIGANLARARRILETARLAIRVQGDPGAGPGRNQIPRAGLRVPTGSLVTVVFGRVTLVRVPNLVGADVARARQALAAVRLILQLQGDPRAGNVRTQRPAAGTQVASRSTVNVVFPTSPPNPMGIRLPSVVGLGNSQARARLEALGLVVRTRGDIKGIVISQSPLAGTQVARGAAITLTFPAAGPVVRAPNVVGATVVSARGRIEALGLVLKTQGDTKGIVRSQSPAAGTQVAKGSTITAVFPATLSLVRVPNVVGSTLPSARARLEALGFVVKTEGDIKGMVRSQSPSAGAEVAKGSTINLVFPGATTTVKVPNVVGTTLASARARLEALGFVVTAQGDTKATVRSQNPGAGAEVAKGSTINLVFPGPTATVKVPSVVGTTLASARARLEALGFVVTAQGDTKATVRSQRPSAGAEVAKGSTINLVFPGPTATVKVPNVVGATMASVKARLEALGFVVKTEGDTRGTVRSQKPSAGAEVAKGSTINVVFPAATAMVRVPSVVGSTFAGAKARLEGLGFVVTAQGDTRGTVSSQSPRAMAEAARGSRITLVFAAAAALVEVPNVVGSSFFKARSQLEALGLVVKTQGDTKATVRSLSPRAGQRVAKGSTINLVFPTASATVHVPNVVGSNLASARARLEALGLVVRTQGDPRGKVHSLNPGAGTQVNRGSTVVVVLQAAPVNPVYSVTGTWVCNHHHTWILRQNGTNVTGERRDAKNPKLVAKVSGTVHGAKVLLRQGSEKAGGTYNLTFSGKNEMKGTFVNTISKEVGAAKVLTRK